MPLTKLQFSPGVNREVTTLANEGGWYDCNNIRFRSGYPEKIGGWTADKGTTNSALQPPITYPYNGQGSAPPTGYTWTAPSFWGVCSNLISWVSLVGYKLLGLGTNLKYYIQNGVNGTFYDVTPIRFTSSGTARFAATSGSKTITVTDGGNNAIANDFVTFSGAVSLGGNITATILNAEFQVVSILSSGQYTITASIAANGSDTGNGGSAVVAAYQINTGNFVFTNAYGWGAGPWGGIGSGGASSNNSWGTPASNSTLGTDIRLWSSANYGQNLVTNPSGGGIYYWVVDNVPTTFNRAQQLSATNTNTQNGVYNWLTDSALFTGSISGTTLTVTAVTTGYINIGATITGGSVPANVTVVTPLGTTIGGVGTYTLSTSVTQSSTSLTATVNTCPTLCNFIMVSDVSNFVIAFGCNDPGGFVTSSTTTVDPLLVRWTDQQNILSWYPTLTNQAGSQRLSQGSTIVTAIQTRQEILIFTNTALYNMQYLGPPYVWGFQTMGENISVMSPNCVAVANNTVYWMGYNKFYFYNGTVQTLPCAVRQYIFDNINLQQSEQIFAGTNEAFSEIWWFYPSITGPNGTGTQNNPNNNIDSYVIFNYLNQVWYYGNIASSGSTPTNIARSAWLYSPIRNTPMATTFNGQLMYHENGVDDGTAINSSSQPAPIGAYVQSSDFEIGDGNNFGFVWRCVPDINFTGSYSSAPVVSMTFLPRQNSGAAYGPSNNQPITSAQSYATFREYYVQQFTQQIYVRIRGRQMALKAGSNTLGVQWQLGMQRLDTRPDGRR